MEIIETDKKNYENLMLCPFSVFDTVAFCELNRNKTDDLKYLVFYDGKNRFALAAGIKGDVLKLPFSASFAVLSPITRNNKIICFHESVRALSDWAKARGCRKVVFSLPPHFYEPTYLTMLYNALWNEGYRVEDIEVNFEYYLKDFSAEGYEMSIDPKARQKLRASLKNDLSFEKTDDLDTVYGIIKINREYRGFPLWMSLEDVRKTRQAVDMDFFLVRNSEGRPMASALVYHITDKIVRVIYWGNIPEGENLRVMNFLAFHVFEYYKRMSYEIIDIGHSTDDSIPNYGLCDFKQAIGCKSSPKFVFVKDL